jgi:hypothetical protein
MTIDPEDELRSYGQTAPAAFTAPPVGRIRAAAVRRRQHRLVAATAAGIVVAGGIGAGAVLAGGAGGPEISGTPAPRTSVPSATPSSASTPGTPPPSSGSGSSSRSTAPASLDITKVAWGRATFTLPNVRSNGCPAGVTVTNVPGQESVVSGVRVAILLPLAYGDLDGDGRPEAVIYIHCESRTGVDSGDGSGQLLAITVRDNRLVGLGYAGPEAENYPAARISGQRLTATIEQRYGGAQQERTYRWNGQRFVQVGGPTAFPTPS